jgi:predicted transcriptional regulator
MFLNQYDVIVQDGIDAGGVRRDFIAGLLNELFTKKIFINRSDTNKYFINPLYEPDELFLEVIKKITTRNYDKKKFYNFLFLIVLLYQTYFHSYEKV